MIDPTLSRDSRQTGYAIVPVGQMTAVQILRRWNDRRQCEQLEKDLSRRFNEKSGEHKQECDLHRKELALGKKREKPKRQKKRPDVSIFGAGYFPAGFRRPPRPHLMGYLANFCNQENPFEVSKNMRLWWQSYEHGDSFDDKKETSCQTPSRQNGSNTWVGCYCGFELKNGDWPPIQWHNDIPGEAERFQTWCSYPGKYTLKNPRKQTQWDKERKEWKWEPVEFCAISFITISDNNDANCLWWHWQQEKACRWALMGFECPCCEYWTPEGSQHPTPATSYRVVPVGM